MKKILLICFVFFACPLLAEDCGISDTIEFMYPNAHSITPINPNGDFKLKDDSDGGGIYIDEWYLNDPQPSMQLIVANIPNCMAVKKAKEAEELAKKKAVRAKLKALGFTDEQLPILKDLVNGQ